jgi:hypothetical protein
MPESLYNAINGQEAKTMLIKRLTDLVNQLPYMKWGNTFHRFYCWFKVDIRAYPADVPTPFLEAEFEIKASDLDKIDNKDIKKEYDLFVTNFDKSLGILNIIDEKMRELNEIRQNVLDFVNEHYPEVLSHVGEIKSSDDATPDYLRVNEGLPLHVLEQDRNTNRTYEKEQSYKPTADKIDLNVDIMR